MSNGTTDYSTRGIVDRMQAAIRPTFKQGTQAVRQAASGAARRKGQFGAFDIASQATEPFGAQMGKAAAAAGVAGEELGSQMERQLRDLTFRREQLAESKRAEEARLGEMMAGRQQTGQLSMFPQTGFTQEMLKSLGYPGTPRDPFGPQGNLNQFQRSLEGMQRRDQLPGIPFGGGGFGSQQGLTAQQQLNLSRMYPGMSRAGRMMQSQNLGMQSGPIQPGQFRG
jgi:hypothetical protein